MDWRVIAAAALLAVFGVPPTHASAPCTGTGSSGPYSVAVGSDTASGIIAYPVGTPTAIVAAAHGWTGSSADFNASITNLATYYHAIAVAMEFRGDARDYKLFNGTEDTAAAIADLQATCGPLPVILWGFSMGGHISALTVMTHPGIADYLVDDHGPTNIPELLATLPAGWAALASVAPVASENPGKVEAYCTPSQAAVNEFQATGDLWGFGSCADGAQANVAIRREYERHPDQDPVSTSPALNPQAWSASGLQRAFLEYGSADAIVTSDQGLQLESTLIAAGIPARMYESAFQYAPGNAKFHPSSHESTGLGIVQAILHGLLTDDVVCPTGTQCINEEPVGLATEHYDPVSGASSYLWVCPWNPSGMGSADALTGGACTGELSQANWVWNDPNVKWIPKGYGPLYPNP